MGLRLAKNQVNNEDKEGVEKNNKVENYEEERKKLRAIDKDEEPASVTENQETKEKENRRTEDKERYEQNYNRHRNWRKPKRNRGGRLLQQRNAIYGRPYGAGYRGFRNFDHSPTHYHAPNDFSTSSVYYPPEYPHFVHTREHSQHRVSKVHSQIDRCCCCPSHNNRPYGENNVCGCPHRS